MKRTIGLLLLGILFRPSLFASDKVDPQEAVRRMEQAVAKTNIFELPSFVMEATIEIDNHGKPVSGTYQLLWNGPDQWREAISLPGYSEVQTGGKGIIWLQRSTDFTPLPIYNVHGALGFGALQPDFSRKTVKKQHERNEHGGKLACFEMEDEHKHDSEICLNENTGLLARNSPSRVDDDFQPIGGKVFPRSSSWLENGKPVVNVNITELVTPGKFPPSAFAPPTGVIPEPGCMNPSSPHLIKRVNPEYPSSARAQRIQGTVKMDVVIGSDGVPIIRKVVESPDPQLESSARHAVEAWRYDPATCKGQPVQDPTILQVNYSLSY